MEMVYCVSFIRHYTLMKLISINKKLVRELDGKCPGMSNIPMKSPGSNPGQKGSSYVNEFGLPEEQLNPKEKIDVSLV